jgi:hypothetical protein
LEVEFLSFLLFFFSFSLVFSLSFFFLGVPEELFDLSLGDLGANDAPVSALREFDFTTMVPVERISAGTRKEGSEKSRPIVQSKCSCTYR